MSKRDELVPEPTPRAREVALGTIEANPTTRKPTSSVVDRDNTLESVINETKLLPTATGLREMGRAVRSPATSTGEYETV
jgi:hypothetical protein